MVEFNLVLTQNMPRASPMHTSIFVGIVYIFRIFKDSMKRAVLIHMLWVLVGIPNYPCVSLSSCQTDGQFACWYCFFLLCGIFRMWHVSILCFIYWRRQNIFYTENWNIRQENPMEPMKSQYQTATRGKSLKQHITPW